MTPKREPTILELAQHHCDQLASALENFLYTNNTSLPEAVAQATVALQGFYGSAANPRAKLTAKERRALGPTEAELLAFVQKYHRSWKGCFDVNVGTERMFREACRLLRVKV